MWRVAVVLVLFMSGIVAMVAYVSTKKPDLVAEDYYQQEVDYQETIEAKSNAQDLKKDLKLKQNDKIITIHFPLGMNKKVVSGSVYFYHPQSSKFDVVAKLEVSTKNTQQLIKTSFAKGNYTVKIKWTDGEKNYQIEKAFFVS